MERRGDEVHVETTEASGGSREGVVRWVLIIGTLLAIVLLSAIWITGAAFQGKVESEGDVGGQIQAAERGGDSTDSIVGESADEIRNAPEPTAGAADPPLEGEPD